MNAVNVLRIEKQQLIDTFSDKNNRIATLQIVSTIAIFSICWYLALRGAGTGDNWLTLAATAGISLILLRVFVLMHECGHNALFSSPGFNRCVGFVLGVLCGMPQYVWSRHHDFHHATNGNWDRYRGPLGTLTVDEYLALTKGQQRRFILSRSIAMAPLGGFLYLVINPRLTWLKGSLAWLSFLFVRKLKSPGTPIATTLAEFPGRYWKTPKEYLHMTANNLVLFTIWGLTCRFANPTHFFLIYGITLAVAGGGGIILFTVQHNFEGALASDSAHWDYHQSALEGTSFLILPKWLNWFTADIAYHHIHHLSARIPNYNLARCHAAYEHLFTTVPRLKLRDIPGAVRNSLWDIENQCLTSPKALAERLACSVEPTA